MFACLLSFPVAFFIFYLSPRCSFDSKTLHMLRAPRQISYGLLRRIADRIGSFGPISDTAQWYSYHLPPYDSQSSWVTHEWASAEMQSHRIACLLQLGESRHSLLSWHADSTGWQAVISLPA